jgi:hypothetical protein
LVASKGAVIVKPDNIAEFDALLDATAYEQFLTEEEH